MWPHASSRVFCLIVLAPWFSYGRTWVQVIDTSIYESALDDPYRSAFTFESMNLLPTVDTPSLLPTPAPLASIIAAPTLHPTSRAPTVSPSQQVKCLAETDLLYNIQFMDSWGDGWSGTWLEISKEVQSVFSTGTPTKRTSIYNGTLHDGAESEAFVCLSRNICYNLFTGGGKWEDEVKWSIREAFDGTVEASAPPITLVKGRAPVKCQFSIPDEDGVPSTCPVSCWTPTVAPTAAPTVSSSHHPTIASTETVSDRPSMIPSSNSAASIGVTRRPSSNIDSKLGSTDPPSLTNTLSNSPSPSMPSTPTFMPTDGNLVRKPILYVRNRIVRCTLTSPTRSSEPLLSDSPSQVPSTDVDAEAPTPAPTGGDVVLTIEDPTDAPTGGDAIVMDTPTQSPTRIFSVRVGQSDWIWPTSTEPTSKANLGGATLSHIAIETLSPTDSHNSEITLTNAPSKAPTSEEPTKTPSLSRSSHFFLQLQENLAAIRENDEVLVSDYPSGAPSVRRGFFT